MKTKQQRIEYINSICTHKMPKELLDIICESEESFEAFKQSLAEEENYQRRNQD